jgi:hypothetical protein
MVVVDTPLEPLHNLQVIIKDIPFKVTRTMVVNNPFVIVMDSPALTGIQFNLALVVRGDNLLT